MFPSNTQPALFYGTGLHVKLHPTCFCFVCNPAGCQNCFFQCEQVQKARVPVPVLLQWHGHTVTLAHHPLTAAFAQEEITEKINWQEGAGWHTVGKRLALIIRNKNAHSWTFFHKKATINARQQQEEVFQQQLLGHWGGSRAADVSSLCFSQALCPEVYNSSKSLFHSKIHSLRAAPPDL